MINQNPEHWQLTVDERMEARAAGVNCYLAYKFGVEACRIQVLTAKLEHAKTTKGLLGHMVVRVDWTTPDSRWHMRNLRFNGELPYGLEDFPEEHITLLGNFAERRDIETKDYTRDQNNQLLVAPDEAMPAIVAIEPEVTPQVPPEPIVGQAAA